MSYVVVDLVVEGLWRQGIVLGWIDVVDVPSCKHGGVD